MPEMQNSRLGKFRTVLSVLFLLFTVFSISLATSEADHEIHCTEDVSWEK